VTPRPRGGGGGGGPRPATPAQRTSQPLEQKLISIARVAFLATEVTQSINHMHKMRPNSAAVLKAAAKWYTASKHVGDSVDELKGAYIDLGGYWEGRAYSAFQEYMKEDVTKVAERNESVLFEIGNALIGVHNIVVEHYNQAATLFGNTLTRAIELHGEWQVAKEETRGAWRQQLYNCISLFVHGITERRREVDLAVRANAAAMTALRGQVQQIRSPGKVPTTITDKDKWKLS
jgi:uncharacterized protein YukE